MYLLDEILLFVCLKVVLSIFELLKVSLYVIETLNISQQLKSGKELKGYVNF